MFSLTKLVKRIYIFIAIVDVIGIVLKNNNIREIAMSIAMPCLFYYILLETPTKLNERYLILSAVFFSWIGDMAMTYGINYNSFFVYGVISFLTAHLFYIANLILFISKKNQSIFIKKPYLFLIVLLYFIALDWFILPSIDVDLKLPIVIYSVIICSLLLLTLHMYKNINAPSNNYYLIGAILFIISDTLIVISKFYHTFFLDKELNTITYFAAQYYFAKAFINQKTEELT